MERVVFRQLCKSKLGQSWCAPAIAQFCPHDMSEATTKTRRPARKQVPSRASAAPLPNPAATRLLVHCLCHHAHRTLRAPPHWLLHELATHHRRRRPLAVARLPPPAPIVQVDAPVTGHEEVHAPGTVNAWTGRVLREYRKPREEGQRRREASKYRCHPRLDSGWTRGADSGQNYCCLYFARGIWCEGAHGVARVGRGQVWAAVKGRLGRQGKASGRARAVLRGDVWDRAKLDCHMHEPRPPTPDLGH